MHIFDDNCVEKKLVLFSYTTGKKINSNSEEKRNTGTSTISLGLIKNVKETINQVFCLKNSPTECHGTRFSILVTYTGQFIKTV